MAFQDYLSRTGYNPQFLNTGSVTGAATPPTSREDLTSRLLQVMSGNLGGTLSGGEKLSALGALLKSVSRGSQTSPQDVVRGIQQQKMAEVQGALQIQELRKQAAKQAQTELQRQQLIENETDPKRKAYLATISADAIDKIAAEEFKYRDPLQGLSQMEATLARRYGYNTPEYNRLMDEYLSKPQYMTGPGGGVYQVPGLSIRPVGGADTTPAPSQAGNPDPELIAEAKRRGII